MIQNLNEEKAKLKEEISKELDNYFELLENSTNQEGFDINKLERHMLENQRKLKTLLNDTNSELASHVDSSVKKTAQNAENP